MHGIKQRSIEFLIMLLLSALFVPIYAAEIQPRIIGGTPANANEHGYFVALVGRANWPNAREKDQYTLTTYCGASLIKSDLVITAAHCVEDLPTNGAIGVLIGNNSSDMSFEVCTSAVCTSSDDPNNKDITGFVWIDKSLESLVIEVPADQVFIHPLYNSNTLAYDIALLRLSQPVGSASLLKLPDQDYFASYVSSGTDVTVIGHGDTVGDRSVSLASPDLLEVKLKPRSAAECRSQYGSKFESTNMICAGYPGKDSCQGDSGGPLTDATNSYLLGIVSWGPADCGTQAYGVYTDVFAFKSWIENGSWSSSPAQEELRFDTYTSANGEVVRMGAGSSGSELLWLAVLLVSVRFWRKRHK